MKKSKIVLAAIMLLSIVSLTMATPAAAITLQQQADRWICNDYHWGRVTVNTFKEGAYWKYTVTFEWRYILNPAFTGIDGDRTYNVRGLWLNIWYTDGQQTIYNQRALEVYWSYIWPFQPKWVIKIWNFAASSWTWYNDYTPYDYYDRSGSLTLGPFNGGGGNYVAEMWWEDWHPIFGYQMVHMPELGFYLNNPY